MSKDGTVVVDMPEMEPERHGLYHVETPESSSNITVKQEKPKKNKELSKDSTDADKKPGADKEIFEDGTITLDGSVNRSSKKKAASDNDRARGRKKAWEKDRDSLTRASSRSLWDPAIQETARRFSENALKEFREIFTLFDKDRSGFISGKELTTCLKCLGQDPEEDEVKEIIEGLDINENGVIEFNEFLTLMAQISLESDNEKELMEVFRVLDQDDDGHITLKDLREVSKRLGAGLTFRDFEEMVAEVDKDGDGRIQFDEFLLIVTSRI